MLTLSRCNDWKVFATLTWSNAQPPTSTCQHKLLFAYLYRVSAFYRIPFRRLLWVVRHEKGEQTNRPHYHALIGWRGASANISQCFALNSLWTKTNRLCGFSRHYVYETGQDALSYITKGLSGGLRGGRLDASNYEAAKFGWSNNEVMLSESLCRLISRAQGIDGQSTRQQREKTATKQVERVANIAAKTNREFDLNSGIVERPGRWSKRRWA